MATGDFHNKPFDEGTLTKLEIFELYTREWIPVFLSPKAPFRKKIHLFDFFAGPGTDSAGTFGSPLRLLRQLKDYGHLPNWGRLKISAHLFDGDAGKISQLLANIKTYALDLPGLDIDARALPFQEAFRSSLSFLTDKTAAKLLFLDQFGVAHVSKETFQQLIQFPTCDFLFFLSSSTLHRFRDVPSIEQKIKRPNDYYHVHRAALAYYKELIPPNVKYYLAPFSIKKGANIYGIIFGSAHPLGVDKFLEVAWRKDAINGEADFDVNRDNLRPGEQLLPIFQPSKISAFQSDLKGKLEDGEIKNEFEIIQLCFDHGVRRKHAEPVLADLKRQGIIDCDFRVPDTARINDPRHITFLNRP